MIISGDIVGTGNGLYENKEGIMIPVFIESDDLETLKAKGTFFVHEWKHDRWGSIHVLITNTETEETDTVRKSLASQREVSKALVCRLTLEQLDELPKHNGLSFTTLVDSYPVNILVMSYEKFLKTFNERNQRGSFVPN